MTAHGEVVRSYEPEEMEPTKKQRFCALVHGSARLDDHAIIGDVIHERTVQRRVRQRTHELWMGTFTSGRARRSDSNQAFSLCPLVIRQERGMRHGAVHPPVLGHGCGEDLKGASKQASCVGLLSAALAHATPGSASHAGALGGRRLFGTALARRFRCAAIVRSPPPERISSQDGL